MVALTMARNIKIEFNFSCSKLFRRRPVNSIRDSISAFNAKSKKKTETKKINKRKIECDSRKWSLLSMENISVLFYFYNNFTNNHHQNRIWNWHLHTTRNIYPFFRRKCCNKHKLSSKLVMTSILNLISESSFWITFLSFETMDKPTNEAKQRKRSRKVTRENHI